MSEEPKKEKKKATDYAGIAALITAIPTALATFYGIMSYQEKIDQKGSETKQYSTVLAQGAFNAQNVKIDALKDKDTELLLELSELRHELELMKVTCDCGNKKDNHRPKAARISAGVKRPVAVHKDKPECSADNECEPGFACIDEKCVPRLESAMPPPPPPEDVSSEAMPEPRPEPMEKMMPSFEQIQEQAEEGAPWGADLFGGQEEK